MDIKHSTPFYRNNDPFGECKSDSYSGNIKLYNKLEIDNFLYTTVGY